LSVVDRPTTLFFQIQGLLRRMSNFIANILITSQMYNLVVFPQMSHIGIPGSDKSNQCHKLFNELCSILSVEKIVSFRVLEFDFRFSTVEDVDIDITYGVKIFLWKSGKIDRDVESVEMDDDVLVPVSKI